MYFETLCQSSIPTYHLFLSFCLITRSLPNKWKKTTRSDHYLKVETALEEKLQAHISTMYPSKVLRINYTYIIKFFYSLPIVTCNELALCRIVHIFQTFYLFSNISESVKKKICCLLVHVSSFQENLQHSAIQ